MHNWFNTEWNYGSGAGIYALVETPPGRDMIDIVSDRRVRYSQ
jgi:hypothetical protein